MSEATHAGYKEDGVEKYEILATLDSKTCEICGELDGNVYRKLGRKLQVSICRRSTALSLYRCPTLCRYAD